MNRFLSGMLIVAVIAGVTLSLLGCGGKGVEGTYSNATGLVVLELRSGGKATLTLMGDTSDCTYTVEGNKINLNCKGEQSVFTLNGDGSLTGPGFIGMMRKAKS